MREIKPVIISFLLIITFGNFFISVKGNDAIPITPNDEFFIESIDFFDIDPESYRLVVTGEVTNPLNLSLNEIKAMPVVSEIVRLTCVAYRYGADSLTGVANWTGVRLSHILSLAKINYFSVKLCAYTIFKNLKSRFSEHKTMLKISGVGIKLYFLKWAEKIETSIASLSLSLFVFLCFIKIISPVVIEHSISNLQIFPKSSAK